MRKSVPHVLSALGTTELFASFSRAVEAILVMLCVLGYPNLVTPQSRHAGSAAAPVASRGTVTGRVFAVTQGGDVKPAILADVYLFFMASVHPDGTVIDPGPTADPSADLLYSQFLSEQMRAMNGDNSGRARSEHGLCLRTLLSYQGAIVETLQAVPAQRRWQVVTGQTDEAGNFTLSVPRTGRWGLVIHGQAGANDAVWINNSVLVTAGKATTLKLTSPEEACLNAND